MPTIDEGRKKLQAGVQGGALVPAPSPAAAVPVPVPMPTYPAAPNPALRTPMPKTTVLEPDTVRQFFNPATPQTRVPPLPPTANPVSGAQAQSQAITVVQAGQGTLLETNNVPNAKQSVLNLVAGTNITLSSDAQGGVTITGTAGGDGLTHGDPIWEHDSAYVEMRDDFCGGQEPGSATQGVIGDLSWNYAVAGGTLKKRTGGCPQGMGAIDLLNSGVADVWGHINLSPGGSADDTFMPLLDYPGWKLTFVFGFQAPLNQNAPASSVNKFAKKSMYIGLFGGGNAGSMPSRPRIFIGLRYDTDTTAPSIGDTHFVFEVVTNTWTIATNGTRTNTQGTTVDTGVSPALGWHRLDIRCVTAGQVKMSLDGGAESTFTVSTVASGGGSGTVAVGGNLAQVTPAASGPAPNDCGLWVMGSKVTITGNTHTQYNGAFTCRTGGQNRGAVFFDLVRADESFVDTPTVTGFPALLPFWSFGNDTQAAPTGNVISFAVDYFSLIWNRGGLATGGGSTSSTQPRYWA